MTRSLFAFALAALFFSTARAQPVSFDPATLDALFNRPAKVEVNLSGPLLRMASMATDDDPETSAMIRGLRAITVRVYNLADAGDGLDTRLGDFGNRLTSAGWQTLVRVRPDDEDSDDVWVYVRVAGDIFDGMAVMALDNEDGEASFVFIDGPIDPSQVGRLGGKFGVSIGDSGDDAVGDALEEAGEDREMARQAREEARQQAEDDREEAREQARKAREDARRRRGNN